MAGASDKKEKVEVGVPSTHETYLKEVTATDREAPVFVQYVNPGDTPVVNEDGYAGTDPIYHGRANKTDQPLAAKSGPFKAAEEFAANAYGDGDDSNKQLKENFAAVSRVGSPKEVETSSSDESDGGASDSSQDSGDANKKS